MAFSSNVLRVSFDGFWNSFSISKNLFIDILQTAYPSHKLTIVHEGNTDILFISVFGRRSVFNPIITVCFNGESKLVREIPQCDLLLGYMPLGFDVAKFIELPLLFFLLYGPTGTDAYSLEEKTRLFSGIDLQNWHNRLDKCVVLLSNPADHRLKYVIQLEKYFSVDLYGRAFGRPIPGGREGKMALLKQYRYHYCSENSCNPGYVTEKLFDAAAAGCIPIYNKVNIGTLQSVSLNTHAIYDESDFLDYQPNAILNPSSLSDIPIINDVSSKSVLFKHIGDRIKYLYSLKSPNSLCVYVCHYTPNVKRKAIVASQEDVLRKYQLKIITQSDASSSRDFQDHLQNARSRYPVYLNHYRNNLNILSIHAYAVSVNGGSIDRNCLSIGVLKSINMPSQISGSELSLNLKHRTALGRFLMSPANLCIVLEDDAIPIPTTSHLIELLTKLTDEEKNRHLYIDLGGGCRLNYCSYSGITSHVVLLEHRLYDVINPSSRTTCAYLVNKSFAEYFLTLFPQPFAPIDFEYLFCLQTIHKSGTQNLRNQWLDPPAFLHGSQEYNLQSTVQKSNV
jgi:GR25 family glycosyltransferase involved in LPS biosynthesis